MTLKPTALTVAALMTVILSAAPAAAEEYVGRLSYHWSLTHDSAVHADMLAAEVNKRAEGRLRIDVFPSGQMVCHLLIGGN